MTSPQPTPQQSNTARDAAAVAALLEARLLAQAAVFGGVLARTGSATAWQRLLHAQTDARLLVRRTLPLAAAAGRAQVHAAAHGAQREVIAHLRARQLPLTVLPLPSPLVNTHFGAPRVPAVADVIGLPSVEQIAQRLAGDIATATRTVTRSQDAMYRSLVNAVITKTMPTAAHRAEAAQQILDQVAELGIIGLVDKAGRRWNLVSWMQMAARTAAQHAAVSARAQLLAANGQNLVLVTTQVHCCDKCAPYDGTLLAIGPTTQPVAGTLAEAIAHGLLHPNCRCDIGPWTPGDPIPDPTPFDPKIAAHRAVRTEVHRQLRRAHRRRALALTPGAARKALALIRAWTARLRRD